MDTQSLKTMTTDVERDLLRLIMEHLRANNIDTHEAKALTGEFLAFLPMNDKRDLLDKLYQLSMDHKETKELYLKYAKPYEEEDRQKKLALMSEHIKNGQIDNALSVAKGGLSNE